MTPEQRVAADRAFEIVRAVIAKACEWLIGRQVDAQMLEGARAAVLALQRDFKVIEHRVQFINSRKDPYVIVPANLYTALLVAGVRVEPDEVNDAVGQYLDENGVRYQWDGQADKLCVWLVKPLEYIDVSFVVGTDGKVEPGA